MTETKFNRNIKQDIYAFYQDSRSVKTTIDILEGTVSSRQVQCSIDRGPGENRYMLPYRFIADQNFDGIIDYKDLKVFELSGQGMEIDISNQIYDIDEMNASFRLKQGYPRENRTVTVRYRQMKYPINEMREGMKKLLVAYAFDRFYRDLRMEVSGDGVTSWTLNGVNVSIDTTALQALKDMYAEHKKDLVATYKPTIFRKFTGNRILRYPFNKTGFVKLGNTVERFRRW